MRRRMGYPWEILRESSFFPLQICVRRCGAALVRVTGVHDKTIPGEKRVAAVGLKKDEVITVGIIRWLVYLLSSVPER
jgi:hypothetical protein